MSIQGYVEYERREYCNDVRCPVQLRLNALDPESEDYERIRGACRADCIHTTHEFHHWLMDHGYLLIRQDD
jgi:hypothetical protein